MRVSAEFYQAMPANGQKLFEALCADIFSVLRCKTELFQSLLLYLYMISENSTAARPSDIACGLVFSSMDFFLGEGAGGGGGREGGGRRNLLRLEDPIR